MITPHERYLKRKIRSKKNIEGSAERPRLYVKRTVKHIYAQLIDDIAGKTIISVGTSKKDMKECGNIKGAKAVGLELAKKAVGLGIKKVVFDRGGRVYHGRVKAIADSARQGGLEF